MMNWNWRDLDDVDDLIFTDAGWKHSERLRTESDGEPRRRRGFFFFRPGA